MILSQKTAEAGTSLLETSIAACTAALFLGSLFTMNMTAMKTMRTAREATSASQILQQRVEQMRIANWHQVTDADWLTSTSAKLLHSDAPGSESLKGLKETLTLIPYGSSSTSTTKIIREKGTTQIVNRNTALQKEMAMKVVWTVEYSGGVNSQATTRQTVAVLANGGVAKW